MGFWDTAKRVVFGGMGQGPDPANSQYGDRDYINEQIRGALTGVGNRQAPQAQGVRVGSVSTIAGGDQAAARQGLMDLVGRQQAIATGQQEGAGELAVNRQIQRALGAQQSNTRMARGPAVASAFRAGARQSADIGQAGAGMAQGAAMQDAQNANQMIAGVLGQTRGQDIGIAAQNMDAQNQRTFQQAGLDQATSLANMQARLQAMGMNDQAALGYLAQMAGMNRDEMMARLQQEAAGMAQPGLLGSLLSAGGTIGAAYAGRPG
jgi:hypothetical protein